MESTWAKSARRYLAHRDRSALDQAKAEAREKAILELLSAYEEQDVTTLQRLGSSLQESLQRAHRTEEACTVGLLAVDHLASLVELYNRFPLERQAEVLRMGLFACEKGVSFATLVGDLPCIAFYQGLKGTGHYHARELDGARSAYEESISLKEQDRLWLDSAETHYNLALLEEEEGKPQQALARFEACVERSERGLEHLREREHRDLFKAKIEPASLRLIEHYGSLASGNGEVTRERLVGLLESLRQVETLAGFGHAVSKETKGWRPAFDEMLGGMGELATVFNEEKCAFLWVHATRGSVVFVVLTPGGCRVQVAGRAVVDRLAGLSGEFERAILAWSESGKRAPAWEVATLEGIVAHVPDAARAAYDALPKEVQELLTDERYRTIFLAPCRETVNLPWELVRVPGKGQAGRDGTYLGLRRLLPRTHGLVELGEVLRRQPGHTEGKVPFEMASGTRTRGTRGGRALVVGNPLHTGAPPLVHARRAAESLAGRLQQSGFELLPGRKPLLDEAATAEAVKGAMREEFTLWVHNGHGAWDFEDRYLYLAMAGEGKLPPQSIARFRWPWHPVVHYDCCVVGATLARGGGRFDGHATAALLAGASCVLSSVHPVFDYYAAAFSDKLYAGALDPETPLSLGEALLKARQEMGAEYEDNPLVWAMTVLWGNPWARLV